MKPRYSKRTVDEAVQLLDVYASQMATNYWHETLAHTADRVGTAFDAWDLAFKSWLSVHDMSLNSEGCRDSGAEAAQRLREGWRP